MEQVPSAKSGQNENRCCLPDYTNVSVYLNRYISSEANHLSDGQIDENSGFIKDPAIAASVAISKNLCCSGNVFVGVGAADNLSIPGNNDGSVLTKRFIQSNEDQPHASLFDEGLRWPTHVYCVPAE